MYNSQHTIFYYAVGCDCKSHAPDLVIRNERLLPV